MKTNKTLVIISPAFPANESETFWVPSQQLMVKALQKNFPGLQLVVLALLYPYQSETFTWNGIEVLPFNGNHQRKLKRFFLWRKAWKKLKVIHKEQNVIGILSFWCGECAFIANRFAKRNSIKHFSWICGQDAKKTNRWVRLVRPKQHELFAMSPFLAKKFYESHGTRPGHIVPNAIDPSVFPLPTSIVRDIDI